jgi:hypothetical protein
MGNIKSSGNRCAKFKVKSKKSKVKSKKLSPLRKVGNSMIFRCLTPNPKGEHLKIIELGSPPFGGKGVKGIFGAGSKFKDRSNLKSNKLSSFLK